MVGWTKIVAIMGDSEVFFRYLFFFLLVNSFAGCGTRLLTNRETNPVTEDYIRREPLGDPSYAVLSTRPDRRSVFINMSKNDQNYMDICAEPPADVAEAFAKSQAFGASNESVQQGTQSLAYSSSIATAVGQLTRRSQGLQFMRDQMFYLCIERLNGTISDAQYAQMRSEVVRMAASLVANEINVLPKTMESVASMAGSEARVREIEGRAAEQKAGDGGSGASSSAGQTNSNNN